MSNTQTDKSELGLTEDLVRDLRSRYAKMFLESPLTFPRFVHRFTLAEQLETEKEIERFIDETTSEMEKKHGSAERRMAEIEKLKASVKALVARSLRSDDDGTDTDFLDEFSRVGDEFVHEARVFDPRLSLEDIHQALRNVWIVNSFQVFLGKKVALTPAGFAYSLLYPYTDNYLDDHGASPEDKREFVSALRRRLSGESVRISSPSLSIPFELIGMIEEEYPRSSYHEVFQSLLAIHDAQAQALAQQRSTQCLSGEEILEMSVEKGGTSVLADGYVAAGILEDRVKDFAFGFGVCLQLIDDLQDLEEDLHRGHQTLMTKNATAGNLDAITNRLINFTIKALDSGNQFQSPHAQALLQLSRRSCVTLILEAAARAGQKYTIDYLTALETCSPLRFSYLRLLKENLKQKRKSFRRFESTVSAAAFKR